jgi:hypothetical protein
LSTLGLQLELELRDRPAAARANRQEQEVADLLRDRAQVAQVPAAEPHARIVRDPEALEHRGLEHDAERQPVGVLRDRAPGCLRPDSRRRQPASSRKSVTGRLAGRGR